MLLNLLLKHRRSAAVTMMPTLRLVNGATRGYFMVMDRSVTNPSIKKHMPITLRSSFGATRQVLNISAQHRFYSPMTKEEEEAEKQRVAQLSDFKKEQELRQLNREILRLSMLKGINTGELYSLRGRYTLLLKDYGMPMMAYYGATWFSTGLVLFIVAEVGGMDATAVLTFADTYTGLNMASKVDPTLGKVGIILILNEMLEPVRLPFVVLTAKTVIDRLFPPKV
jgi:hypothetical protein